MNSIDEFGHYDQTVIRTAHEWNDAFRANPVPGFLFHAQPQKFTGGLEITAETFIRNMRVEAKAHVHVMSITQGPNNLRGRVIADLLHKIMHEAYVRPLTGEEAP